MSSLALMIRSIREGMAQCTRKQLAGRGFDVNYSQSLALWTLATQGPITAVALARAINLDPGAVTRLLDHLEQKGYVRRQPHEGDRRALRISLTDAGHALWSDFQGCIDRSSAIALQSLSPQEREQLLSLLKRVSTNLESELEP